MRPQWVILISLMFLSVSVASSAAPFDWVYQFDTPGQGRNRLSSPVAVQHPAWLDHRRSTLLATTFATDDAGLSQRALLVWQSPGIAVQIPLLVVSGIPQTIDQNGHGLQTGEYSDVEGGIIVGWGGAVHPNVSFGLNAKLFGHSILQEKAVAAGVDGELVWHVPGVSLGLMVANLTALPLSWSTGRKDPLPLIFTTTLDLQLLPGLTGGLSAGRNEQDTDISAYAGYSFAEIVNWSVKATRQGDLLILDNACRIQLSEMGIVCQLTNHPDLGNRFQAGVVLGLDRQRADQGANQTMNPVAQPLHDSKSTETVYGSEYRMVRYR